MGDKFKISDVKSAELYKVMSEIDRKRSNNGEINKKKEWEDLANAINGSDKLKAELANEDESLKSILYFTSQSTAQNAEAQEAKSASQPTVATNPNEGRKPSVREEVYSAFEKARGYDEEKGKYSKTLKDAYKAVKKEFSDKEKYSKEQRKAYEVALDELNTDRKHGFLIQDAVFEAKAKSLAEDDNGNIVNEQALSNQKTSDVRKAQIDALTTVDGKVDKRAKRALRGHNGNIFTRAGNWLSGNDSAGKKIDKAIAHSNLAATIRAKRYSEAELKAIVNPDLIQALIDTKIIVPDAANEGKYDISEFSRVVAKGLSVSDATYNEHDVDVESENQSIKDRLMLAMTHNTNDIETSDKIVRLTRDMEKDDIRDIVKFLGYYDDTAHNKLVRTYQHTMEGLGSGAFLGGLGGAINSYNVKQTQLVTFDENMTPEDTINLIKSGKALAFVQENGGIFQEQIAKRDVWTAGGLGAAIGAAAGAGLGALQGLLSKGREKEVLGLVPDCYYSAADVANLIENRTKDLEPEQSQAAKQIIVLGYETEFVKDPKTGKEYERFVLDENCNPKWNYCQFLDKYNEMRGNQVLNETELAMSEIKFSNRQVVIDDCKEEKTEVKTYCAKSTTTPTVDLVKVPTTKFEDWGVFASRYACLESADTNFKLNKSGNTYNPNSYARTMMKIMQAISDNNYDLARLQKLTAAAQKCDWATLKADGGFDYDRYMALRGNAQTKTFAMTELNMPTITKTNEDGTKEDICAPTDALYKANNTQNGTGNVIGGRDAYNSVNGEDKFNGTIKTSDGKIDFSTTSEVKYRNKIEELEGNGYTEAKDC